MKKFDQPFDNFELGAERPISVELNPQDHYKHLYNHPIYYYHAFQYTRGGFYRAVFGYEKLWDKDYEESLTLALDYILTNHLNRREYYFEEITTERTFTLYGWRWDRGIKPKRIDFDYEWATLLPAQCRATARINLLDQPSHVDIEFHESGEIYSVSYMRYLTWKKQNFIRSLTYAPRAKPDRSSASHDKCPKAAGLERPGRKDAFKAIHASVPSMRQRFRRSATLQKA